MSSRDIAAQLKRALSDLQLDHRATFRDRLPEYRTVHPEDARLLDILQDLPHESSVHTYWDDLRRDLVDSNPDLSVEAKCAEIVVIDSYTDCTSARHYRGAVPLVTIDAGLSTFLWRMNKVTLYGSPDGEYSRDRLTMQVLVYDAVQRVQPPAFSKIRDGLRRDHGDELGDAMWHTFWKVPKLPPHEDPALASLLGFAIRQQEIFVIAHEIAHIHLMHLKGGPKPRPQISDAVLMWAGQRETDLYQEVAADNLAFQLCLNAFRAANDADRAKAVCLSIYNLFWYFRWLDMVLKHERADYALLWVARYFNFRQAVRELYRWGPPEFIVEASEWMEENMERGAVAATSLYSDLFKYGNQQGVKA